MKHSKTKSGRQSYLGQNANCGDVWCFLTRYAWRTGLVSLPLQRGLHPQNMFTVELLSARK